jgi:hypothetical protein
VAEPGLAYEGSVFGTVAHVEASEEILVFDRGSVSVFVGLEILKISLDQGTQVVHLCHEEMLFLDHPIYNVIERRWRRRRRRFCALSRWSRLS